MHIINLITQNWPFPNGRGRIVDTLGKRVNLGTGERTIQTSDGVTMTVLANDLIGRHLILGGEFHRSIVQTLLDQARPGDVLLDIGANIGYVAGCFLARVPRAKAICVEPQPGIVELLRRNMAPFDSEVHQIALSDQTGELGFHIDDANRGASAISRDGEIKVPALKAADFFGTLDKVDLIKIDVEGHELPIFRSAEQQLKRLKPRAILFEDQTNSREIRDILKRCGYRIYGTQKRLTKTRLTESGLSNDYLAIRD